jgi:integrase
MRPKNPVPSYLRHQATGQARVVIGGKTYYLGPYNSPESRAEYGRLIGEWSANSATVTPTPAKPATAPNDAYVSQLRLAYFRHAETYYVKNGLQTSEVDVIRMAMRVLKADYDHTLAKDFGPLALDACRRKLIAQGLARSSVNKLIGVIRMMFKWGASREMIPGSVPAALATLAGLRKGRSAAIEPEPIGPVADDVVEKSLVHMVAPVAAMVRLQALTGMRPGEVVIMRTRDLNTKPAIWEFRPSSFKTEHHEAERGRVIYIGPQAQDVLRPWLNLDLDSYLFNPAQSVAEINAARRDERKTPLYPSHSARYEREKKARGRRSDRGCYSVTSYRKAIERACDKAEVPVFTPNQLRHSLATRLRREFGLEATGAVLGHSDLSTSQIYAQKDAALASKVMGKIG